MYLRGSKFNYTKKRRKSNPFFTLILLVLIGGALYVNQVVVPKTPPLFLPTPTPTRSPESFLQEAQEFVDKGQYVKAIESYQAALEVSPNNANLYQTIAQLQIYLSHFDDAIENLGNALVINPTNNNVLAMRGYALGRKGNYAEAETLLEQVLAAEPGNGLANAYMAEILALRSEEPLGGSEMVQRAIEYSRVAVNAAPDLMESHRSRGIVLEYTQNYAEAVTEFQSAIEKNKYVSDLYVYLGNNYRNTQNPAEAVKAYTEGIRLNPDDYYPFYALSRTYLGLGDYANAVLMGEQAIERNETMTRLYGSLGVIFYNLEKYPQAIENLSLVVNGGRSKNGQPIEAMKKDNLPGSEYYTSLAFAYVKTNNCTQAIPIANKVINEILTDTIALGNAQEVLTMCEAIASGNTDIRTPSPAP